MTAVRPAAMTVADTAVTSGVLRVAMTVRRSGMTVVVTAGMSAVLRVVMIVVGTTGVRRSGMTAVGTTVMSAARLGVTIGVLRRVVMTVGLRLGGMIVGLLGLGIRVGLGLGRLGMVGLPGSRVASGLGRGVMTGPGLRRDGMIGPGTRGRLLEVTTVDRVAMTGPGPVARSAVAGGTTASAVVAGAGVRTRRGSVRARTIRSFRPASPVRSSTVG
ncbi:hypothetical protein [Kribbella sp. CA-294648]|uniref:hypothetical protein n=1 Tax=Kribbella sp. CA-294648 TaxID=3239948 RepID=UPI003D924DB5